MASRFLSRHERCNATIASFMRTVHFTHASTRNLGRRTATSLQQPVQVPAGTSIENVQRTPGPSQDRRRTHFESEDDRHQPLHWGLYMTPADVYFWLLRLTGIGIILHCYYTKLGSVTYPRGASMLPWLNVEGDLCFINYGYRRGRDVKVGDLVSFQSPAADGRKCKRIIGMSGDFVLAGTPGAKGGSLEGMMMQVPPGHFFAAGDNQAHSRDSRTYGPVPLALIDGKIQLHLWPLSKFGAIPNGIKPSPFEPTPTPTRP